ncbi:MAG: EAL domain-containing protein [Lysobacteraceae bacterium]
MQDSVVRVVLVEDRLEDAEQIISILRNGGIAVRPNRPENEEELERQLANQPLDLVLVARNCQTIALQDVVSAVEASGKDIPVLVTDTEINTDFAVQMMSLGISAIALRDRPEHIQAVVSQEFQALEQRRSTRRLEAALRESERRCDALIDSSRDPIAYVHEGMHIRGNQAYLEMFGYEEFEEIEGLSVLDMVASSHAEEFKNLLKSLSKGEPPPKSIELTAQRSDGTTFDAVMEFTQATYEGEPCQQIVFRQQLIDAEMAAELDSLRSRDQITGLFNRSHFMGQLDDAVGEAAKGSSNQGILLVDIDGYAGLLNNIGLGQADALLRAAGERLQGLLSQSEVCARFSDHGFAVLCRGDHKNTHAIAQSIHNGFQGSVLEIDKHSLNLTVSIGGVQIGEKIASTQQVLAKAGQCLQSSIAQSGNKIEIFDPAARDRAEEERILQWVEKIKQALDKNEFVLHFQPIINLHEESERCYECLLRMRSEGGELIPPMTFLPIAEEHGLMERIDRWVIGRAISSIEEETKKGRTTRLLVKITPDSLADDKLPSLIASQLQRVGASGDHLVLSIPESKVVTNLNAAKEFQQALATNGVGLCIEQFGSGLNSIQMLQHIDMQYLKLDKSFMEDLGKNPDSQAKVRDLSQQARDAGKLTIADYVQDAASMTVLFTSSVDLVEGDFLAPAGPEMNYEFGQG